MFPPTEQKIKEVLSRSLILLGGGGLLAAVLFGMLCIFFDEAVLVRKGTIFKADTDEKLVALTFDDGPSPVWTPMILDELKNLNVKATFFMIGRHVEEYPEIAARVAREGHEIGNHTYDHHGIFFYTKDELYNEVVRTQRLIEQAAGVKTQYFRPPKAWITDHEKQWLKQAGYKVVLWTLNSKDWVSFDDRFIVRYLTTHIRPGEIILFHDSGGVFGTEGGNRRETVEAIPALVDALRRKGYRFVTIGELIAAADAVSSTRGDRPDPSPGSL